MDGNMLRVAAPWTSRRCDYRYLLRLASFGPPGSIVSKLLVVGKPLETFYMALTLYNSIE